MPTKLDHIDHAILAALQKDASLSQRDLAERVALSQNACWRRLKALREGGFVVGTRLKLDRTAFGLDLTVFMMIRTRNHASDWADRFRKFVTNVPEVTEFHRIGGEWDYLLKIVTHSMAGYDDVYQRMISNFDLQTVTGYFSMETIFDDRPLLISV